MSDFFGDSQGDSDVVFNPSVHSFTDPIRYFKANDPYYWEVDNIPLKQIQSNILWLKDQVGGAAAGLGEVARKDFLELRPDAAGVDTTVSVQPGRFMGRVNDAYGTGISQIANSAYTDYAAEQLVTQESVVLSDTVLGILVGKTINQLVGNNGLYDHLQTHASNRSSVGTIVDWENKYSVDTRNDLGVSNIYDIPKIKLSIWGSDTTTHNYYGPMPTDLQQRAVSWTRAWGAPFRTALVNVEDPLYINIPLFSDDDYSNESNYVPSVRVDLLFVYTKPVDASATTIAKPSGSGGPQSITSPQLGLVRGAGVIALTGAGRPGWTGDIIDGDFLGEDAFTKWRADQNQNYWFKEDNAFDSEGNPQITSPVGDLNQTEIGTSGVYGNFPSPDDLMNLAPYLVSDLAGQREVSLVGQSVLPIAYVFVRKGQSVITNNDILDIRPFFRTAELAYNERAGIAAANPPISIANPVVSNSDLTNRIEKLYAALKAYTDDVVYSPPTPVAKASNTFHIQQQNLVQKSDANAKDPMQMGNMKLSHGGVAAAGNIFIPGIGYDPSGLITFDPAGINSGEGLYIVLKRGYAYSLETYSEMLPRRKYNTGFGDTATKFYGCFWRSTDDSTGMKGIIGNMWQRAIGITGYDSRHADLGSWSTGILDLTEEPQPTVQVYLKMAAKNSDSDDYLQQYQGSIKVTQL